MPAEPPQLLRASCSAQGWAWPVLHRQDSGRASRCVFARWRLPAGGEMPSVPGAVGAGWAADPKLFLPWWRPGRGTRVGWGVASGCRRVWGWVGRPCAWGASRSPFGKRGRVGTGGGRVGETRRRCQEGTRPGLVSPPWCAGTRHSPGWHVAVRLSPQLSVYKLPEPCVSLK